MQFHELSGSGTLSVHTYVSNRRMFSFLDVVKRLWNLKDFPRLTLTERLHVNVAKLRGASQASVGKRDYIMF